MNHPSPTFQQDPNSEDLETIDLRKLWRRINRGLPQIIGLGLLGVAIAAIAFVATSPFQSVSTATRVVFSFPGFEKGEYPDKSKFQADDLRAPDVIAEALKAQGLDTSSAFQTKIRGALSIEGIIAPDVIKERDRLRAAGQALPPFIPDEYAITLTLPRRFPLTPRERELFLNEIISVYRENFQRTYADTPQGFGNVFETLRQTDFTDYELILNKEVQTITAYLDQQLEQDPSFRSPTTNMSFGDLLEQIQFFTQINLNATLGEIYLNGVSRNRELSLSKMDYYLHTLEDQENKAVAEATVVQDLLAKAQEHAQNYVLGIKSSIAQPHSETPILDQGLIDSLLANDAYNFLVRKALVAGLKVKEVEADKAQVLERRQRMESFMKAGTTNSDQTKLWASVDKSLTDLERLYNTLISNIRKTDADFAHQQFGDALRFSSEVKTEGFLKKLGLYSGLGFILGAIGGIGLSLLSVYLDSNNRPLKA